MTMFIFESIPSASTLSVRSLHSSSSNIIRFYRASSFKWLPQNSSIKNSFENLSREIRHGAIEKKLRNSHKRAYEIEFVSFHRLTKVSNFSSSTTKEKNFFV